MSEDVNVKRVTLDRETHRYDPDLPSVTTVIRPFMDTEHWTEYGLERGRLVHLACEYLDEGDLDMDALDPSLRPYVEAYAAFRKQMPQRIEWVEIPMMDPHGRYAGTPDRVIRMRPRMLIDIKTGAEADWHRLQTAAYANMLEDPMAYRRFALYLRPDGTFRLKEHARVEYLADLAAFMAALTMHEWKGRRK